MRSENKIGFVILHYCALSETEQCVESIKKKIDTSNYEIIVVDNGSPNGTGQVLFNLYNNEEKIQVILRKENIGFASGNNIGFRIAKYEFHCNFICMLNSDTYLLQNDFFEVIQNDFENYKYYVLGPNVITPQIGEHSNPLGNHKLTFLETRKKIVSLYIQIALNTIGVDNFIRLILKKMRKTKSDDKGDEYYLNYQEDVKLHGCCWIFSPSFIERYDGLIEGTFLYLEEDLLYLQMMQEHRKTLYSPKLKIFHLEDASSNMLEKRERQKQRFVLKNHLQSMGVINKYLKKR